MDRRPTSSYAQDEVEFGERFYREHPARAFEQHRLGFLAEIAALDDGYPGNARELQRLRFLADLAARERDYWEHPANDRELQRMRRLAYIAARDEDYRRSRGKEEGRCPPGTRAAGAASEDM